MTMNSEDVIILLGILLVVWCFFMYYCRSRHNNNKKKCNKNSNRHEPEREPVENNSDYQSNPHQTFAVEIEPTEKININMDDVLETATNLENFVSNTTLMNPIERHNTSLRNTTLRHQNKVNNATASSSSAPVLDTYYKPTEYSKGELAARQQNIEISLNNKFDRTKFDNRANTSDMTDSLLVNHKLDTFNNGLNGIVLDDDDIMGQLIVNATKKSFVQSLSDTAKGDVSGKISNNSSFVSNALLSSKGFNV